MEPDLNNYIINFSDIEYDYSIYLTTYELVEKIKDNYYNLNDSLLKIYNPFLEKSKIYQYPIINDKIYIPVINIENNMVDDNIYFRYKISKKTIDKIEKIKTKINNLDNELFE